MPETSALVLSDCDQYNLGFDIVDHLHQRYMGPTDGQGAEDSPFGRPCGWKDTNPSTTSVWPWKAWSLPVQTRRNLFSCHY